MSLLLSRRRLLRGAASLAVSSLVPGCGGYSANNNSSATPAAPVPPQGLVVQGSLTVTTTAIGAIPSRFLGLSYEKLAITYGYFHASNHGLIALFRRLGPAFCGSEAALWISSCGPRVARAHTHRSHLPTSRISPASSRRPAGCASTALTSLPPPLLWRRGSRLCGLGAGPESSRHRAW